MAEFIEREKALEECDWYANEFCECEYAIMPLKGALEILPAADVRHVVLCRDCMMRQYCKVAQYLGEDGFCSNGEKMEES